METTKEHVEARLAFAKKHYPIGTEYTPIDNIGKVYTKTPSISTYEPRLWIEGGGKDIEVGDGLIYSSRTNTWAEIIDKVEKFNMDTIEGRLAYARKHYTVGTEYYNHNGDYRKVIGIPNSFDRGIDVLSANSTGETGFFPDIYDEEKGWCKIIETEQEEKVMDIQKLSRKGLKEIHSVACSAWKCTLEVLGKTNPLEDYIELSQEDVAKMFKACTKEQLPIVSKYLKQNTITNLIKSINTTQLKTVSNCLLTVRVGGEYEYGSLVLNNSFDWKIKEDSCGYKCLIPTKKK